MKISYKESGVDIDAGNELVDKIKPIVKTTHNANVLGNIGSFSGAYELPTGYKQPVLLSATDGVGTKLKLAIEAKKYDTIGIDLVAMVVNDLICNFAKPLYFLDYFATERIDVPIATQIIEGIAKGCSLAQCALIGGESAEMPDLYKKDDFDLAGFGVGIAEKEQIDRTKFINEGDTLIALPSSGIHSNGYSLVRHVLFKHLNMSMSDKIEQNTISDILLEPTRIYVDEFLQNEPYINAIAHITGGGIVENIPRVLPNHLGVKIKKSSLQVPAIFSFLSEYVSEEEMYRTFNMGVGLVLVVNPANVQKILDNTDGYTIGEVVARADSAEDKGIELI